MFYSLFLLLNGRLPCDVMIINTNKYKLDTLSCKLQKLSEEPEAEG